jgi:hypothetical protein
LWICLLARIFLGDRDRGTAAPAAKSSAVNRHSGNSQKNAEEKCSWSADGYQAVVLIHTLHKMPAAAGEGIAILITLGDVAVFQDDRSLGKKSPLRFAAAEKQGERKQK